MQRLLLILILLVLPATPLQAAPNIVFILADDLSWSDLACYGHPYHQTPHLDRLAEEGMRFTQAYAPAPICSASRAAILTGKTPARLHFEFVTKADPGGQDFDVPMQSPPFTLDLPLSERTMGEALGECGYTTGFFGKWHVSRHHQGYLGWSPTHGPLKQGFTEGDSDFGSHPYVYREKKGLKSTPVKESDFPEDTLVEKATEFLNRHQDEPFFLYLSQYYVHDPVHSRSQSLIEKYWKLIPEGSKEIRIEYAAMVETLDHLVGRVLSELDRLDLADDTFVVFLSDNGGHPNYTTNAPLRGSKWNLYEGGIRVPMIARWPGKIEAGAECDVPVHGCDLLPTFRAVADQPQKGADGTSLLPLMTGRAEDVDRSEPLVWHFPYYHPEKKFADCPKEIGVGDFVTSQTRPHSAIRSGDWKLIQFYEEDRIELYNLTNDLAEQHDLSAEHPKKARELRRELNAYLNQVEARLPQPRQNRP